MTLNPDAFHRFGGGYSGLPAEMYDNGERSPGPVRPGVGMWYREE
jgi:hypothetical protein